MNNYFSIGKLVAAYGVQGELILQHSLGKRTSLKGVEALFIEDRRDSFIPYFLTKAKAKDHSQTYVKLEGIDSREHAMKFLQKGVFLSEEDFKQHAAGDAPLSLLGFLAVDEAKGELGTVEEVIELPHQVLAKVVIGGKEVLIPINEQTLVEVKKKQKLVQLKLPEGLIDLYL
ncbi:16S rRNA processing protein RimM [Chitinophaga caeni]|uniref:Ribosome maturation factor RimM n=1 Tax=Chitinophaga caeni TaxID=2029983 RepID=A0A291QT92_9BACT|nr:ribosome maturation factor RimM [Chitinophaga caeni]ATL47165.1 16S rRNA processing protein RimM [Chitinophaga caeni]